jgi:arylsulfatase A-like enzyme
MMLAGAGITRGRREERVSLMDVVPTVLAAAGLPAARDLDGRPLLESRADRELLIQGMGRTRGNQFRALVRGTKKWVVYSENGEEQSGERRMYDLRSDPQEQHPAPWSAGQAEGAASVLLAALRDDPDPSGLPAKESILVGRRLTAAKARPSEGLPVVSREVDPETLERLRALGYVQ